MRNTNVDKLLAKFIENDISGQEMEQLLLYLREGHDEELKYAIDNALRTRDFAHLAANSQPAAVLGKILSGVDHKSADIEDLKPDTHLKKRIFAVRSSWIAAASVLIMLGCAALFFFNARYKSIPPVQQLPGTNAAAFTRFLVLPDSSTVVLKANSKLVYGPSFGSSKREVNLTGEAYFDIRHDAQKPFIIHTGAVKTIVLGTAFNIKAVPGTGEVTVSVARGKVRVENQKAVIAVLLPNQQIVYSTSTASGTQQQVNVNKIVTDWTTEDMVFESVSMSAIAATLSKRYGVNIKIQHPGLMECPVKISFSGTESLEDVITALCTVTNASFATDKDGQILIDGEGCQ